MRLLPWALILLTIPVLAQTTVADRQRIHQLSAEANRSFRENKIDQAVALLENILADPAIGQFEDERSGSLYNLACGYSRLGKKAAAVAKLGEAVAKLGEAVASGYEDYERIQEDTDFDNIRREPGYLAIIEKLKTRALFWEGPAWKTAYRENLSAEEKLAGLSRVWSEAKFNFAWFEHLPKLDWDALYISYIPKVEKSASTLEYYQLLQEMVAQLHDGHTNVYVPKELSGMVYGRPPMRTRLIENRVLIVELLNDKLREAGFEPGQEITAIDGSPVKEYAESHVRPYQSSSTSQDLDVRTYDYALLAGASNKPAELTLVTAKGETLHKSAPRNLLNNQTTKLFSFTLLPGNVAYVELRSFGSDEAAKQFGDAFEQIRKADKLILDVRENDGGSSNIGWTVLSYLTDKPFPASLWRTREYRPAERAWGTQERWYGGDAYQIPPHGGSVFSGPVVVLTSARTFSAAEDFATVFEAMHRGTMIGEATGGSTGQPLFIQLPGGGTARFCTKQDRSPTGKEFVGVGVQPNKVVHPSVADVRAGRDTVLEAALAFLK